MFVCSEHTKVPKSQSEVAEIKAVGTKKVPSLALESLHSRSTSINLQGRNAKVLSHDVREYTKGQCHKDAMEAHRWVIRNKTFSDEVAEEVALFLNYPELQNQNLETIQERLEKLNQQILQQQQQQYPVEFILNHIKSEMKQNKITIKAGLKCKKNELVLLGCVISPEFIEEILKTGLKTLHIQRSLLDTGCARIFEKHLKDSKLETLIFTEMKIEPLDLESIAKGLSNQNDNSEGVKELFITASLIDATYVNALKILSGQCHHLRQIDLSGNKLGSRSRRHESGRISIKEEPFYKNKETFKPEKRQQRNLPLESKNAVQEIVNAALENRGNLKLIVLADNRLKQADLDLLVGYKSLYASMKKEGKDYVKKEEAADGEKNPLDSLIHFNIAHNGFKEGFKEVDNCVHLSNSTPRQIFEEPPRRRKRRVSKEVTDFTRS